MPEAPTKADIHVYVDSRLRELMVADANERDVSLVDLVAEILAKSYDRPDLAAVPRKRMGRPLGLKPSKARAK